MPATTGLVGVDNNLARGSSNRLTCQHGRTKPRRKFPDPFFDFEPFREIGAKVRWEPGFDVFENLLER